MRLTASQATGDQKPENMSEEKILACPICGKTPEVQKPERATNGELCQMARIRCKPCDLDAHGYTDEEAARKWNKRAGGRQPEAPPNAELKPVRFGELLDGLRQVLGSIQKEKRDAFLNGYSFEEWLAYQQEDAILGAIGVVYDRSKREPSND